MGSDSQDAFYLPACYSRSHLNPERLKNAHVLALLPGCASPMILERVERTTNYFKVVTAAFVEPWMLWGEVEVATGPVARPDLADILPPLEITLI